MTKKYKILAKYIKDMSSETPDVESYLFTKDNIDTYISYKRENEVNPMNLRPHPHEFNLYYDV